MLNRSRLPVLLVLALLTAPAAPAAAQPIPKEKIPGPLQPWVDWVLWGQEEARCPFFQAQAEQRQCAWPSRLDLDLGEREGRFSQQWLLYKEGWVPLPGDGKLWPQDVRVDGRPAVVAAQRGAPSVRLAAGRHSVSGAFAWDALPPLLQVPADTGIVALHVRGAAVPFPVREPQGGVWLAGRAETGEGESRLEVTVYRRVIDEIPLQVMTSIELAVSGKSREEILGRALLPGSIPMELRSPLPARLEPDGRLRVQARAGTWTLQLVERHAAPVSSLELPDPQGAWDAEEVWVFDARPHLRLVTVEGAPTIDPQQTTLPADWRHLPTYLLKPGGVLTLVEKRRGDADPPPDALRLEREWWLDFDGRGYTIHDHMSGTMERGWRLEMPAPAVLGRVSIGGQDQFITRRQADGPAGVEIRQGSLDLRADSRIEGGISSLPAVGWDQDLQALGGSLNLAPGWRLFHASGVDSVSSTWIASWTLLDLFLVLILALGCARLWGRAWGALALATLGLTWIEPGAPRYVWLVLLAGEALARALPEGRFKTLARAVRMVAAAGLVLIAVPFMVRQARLALYPGLERPWVSVAGGFVPGAAAARSEYVLGVPPQAPEGAEAEAVDEAQGAEPKQDKYFETQSKRVTEESRRMAQIGGQSLSNIAVHDPAAVVQTGPGLPQWQWTKVSLGWSGPVERAQRLRLWLVPPAANFVLAFVRVGLLAALVVCGLGVGGAERLREIVKRLALHRAPAGLLLALGAALAGLGAAPAHAQMPSNEMLEALKHRLLAPPDCRPDCASIPRLLLEIDARQLRARLEVHAAADTAVPLPGGAEQWLPASVLLDGAAAPGVVRAPEGRLWLQVPQGSHQVLLEGRLPDRETVQIALPLKPRRVTARITGWRVEGLREDGTSDDNLQLTRVRTREGPAAPMLDPGALPPFVRVERELSLGLKWYATTRVTRLTPTGSPVVLEVPILPGESVTAPEVRVVGGKARVSLGPQATHAAWSSRLEESARIDLSAPDTASWTEVWRVVVGPIWHVEAEGIPLIHLPGQNQTRVREWRPWPGESVRLAASRPEGLAGRTLTLDAARLEIKPGLRSTDAALDVSLRSSRGTQHAITLPEGAQLHAVAINGQPQPIRQEGRSVTLPVAPGAASARLEWRQGQGVGAFFRTPEVDLGEASVNARVRVAMPPSRWILFAGGPRLGPAVLFWSILFVAALVSFGLGRTGITPLGARHWFLLSLGLTQVSVWTAAMIVGWLLALGWRRRQRPTDLSNLGFDLYQILLGALSLMAILGLFESIRQGLLGLPEMQIQGNSSSAGDLNWYLDRAATTLPRPWVFSVPLMVYRVAMLAWALWLAQALLGWLKWGWECFTQGGYWRPLRSRIQAPRSAE